jgi:hypothetical protein
MLTNPMDAYKGVKKGDLLWETAKAISENFPRQVVGTFRAPPFEELGYSDKYTWFKMADAAIIVVEEFLSKMKA